MTAVRNVLFVMCDQLRRDFVSCYGGRRSKRRTSTASRRAGVRFDNAFVQAGVCGPSRMSYYTGRYVSSHGATWNRVPLSAAERTLGDYLRAAGRTATLAGKTHVLPDTEALARFGIEIESERGALLREGGFVVRRPLRRPHAARDRSRATRSGCARADTTSADPWTDFVISAVDRRPRRLRLADAQRAPAVARRRARIPRPPT